MDLFVDGIDVRLRSRVHGTYLYADDDGVGVSLRPRGHDPPLAGVWRVQRIQRDGIDYALLHGAAYGRYLALSPNEPAPMWCPGRRAVQRGYDDPEREAVMWRPAMSTDDSGRGDYVVMRHLFNGTLRANGTPNIYDVSIDEHFGNVSTTGHWILEVVPPRQGPPPLPVPASAPVSSPSFLRRDPSSSPGQGNCTRSPPPPVLPSPAATTNPENPRRRAAMDLFADGIDVRLRSRVHGTYLYADDDGVGVSLRPRSYDPFLAGVWRVHRIQRDGIDYALLHGAAYGRYLALSPNEPAPRWCPGSRAVQRGYDDPEQGVVMWRPAMSTDDSGRGDYVVMRHLFNGTLRASGRPNSYDVSIDEHFGNVSTTSHWILEVVPPRQGPPPLPVPSAPEQLNLIPAAPMLRRRIEYMLAKDEEDLNVLRWSTLWFDGRSVLQLKATLAKELGVKNYHNIRFCMRAGSQGRLTPLVTDLPVNEETMDIVILPTELPDNFPRQSGLISNVSGWETVLLGHAGPSDLVIEAQPALSKTVLYLRLWTTRYLFSKLYIDVLNDTTCSVQMQVLRTDELMTKKLPYNLSIIRVPVPDFDCIFKAAGVLMEEVSVPNETTFFSGTQIFRGGYRDADWSVRFFEMATIHGPLLILRFHSPGIVTFEAQMLRWPAFHRLEITRDKRRTDACNVRFQCAQDSVVQFIPDVRPDGSFTISVRDLECLNIADRWIDCSFC